MDINRKINETIHDVIIYNQVMTTINENIAFAKKEAERIKSNHLFLLYEIKSLDYFI